MHIYIHIFFWNVRYRFNSGVIHITIFLGFHRFYSEIFKHSLTWLKTDFTDVYVKSTVSMYSLYWYEKDNRPWKLLVIFFVHYPFDENTLNTDDAFNNRLKIHFFNAVQAEVRLAWIKKSKHHRTKLNCFSNCQGCCVLQNIFNTFTVI